VEIENGMCIHVKSSIDTKGYSLQGKLGISLYTMLHKYCRLFFSLSKWVISKKLVLFVCKKVFFNIFWRAPFNYLYFLSFQLLYEPGLDAGIDPGMVFDTI